jgi:hypothetical protein
MKSAAIYVRVSTSKRIDEDTFLQNPLESGIAGAVSLAIIHRDFNSHPTEDKGEWLPPLPWVATFPNATSLRAFSLKQLKQRSRASGYTNRTVGSEAES